MRKGGSLRTSEPAARVRDVKAADAASICARIFPPVFGVFLGLTLLKFGNPPVTERFVTRPTDIYEFLFTTPWPVAWAFYLLAAVVLIGLPCARKKPAMVWLFFLPLAWFLWQLVAATQSINPELSTATVRHFAGAIACFYLGALCLGADTGKFWLPITVAFALVLAVGFSQHFGGLDETRRYFFTYIYPKLTDVQPEYLKKMSSDRIFSTLFYPNSLAGALLLLLGPVITYLASIRGLTIAARGFLIAIITSASLACLFWSGSKAGWLLFLALLLVFLLRLPFPRTMKGAVLGIILLIGLSGFFWKYSSFFRAGATSVVARFDYWQAALRTAQSNPLVGTGPGTFGKAYNEVKRPESEPARLAHNDYLQQASDSGVPAFLLYTSFVVAGLFYSYPRLAASKPPTTVTVNLWECFAIEEWHRFAVWAGLFIWFLQGLVEFGLYVPGNAWPAFALLAWLLGTGKSSVDKTNPV